MSSTFYDAIVIGAGHNGLVCAAYLARSGRKVLVLEQRPTEGGIAAAAEIFPGFHFPQGAVHAGLFHPRVLADLELGRRGLEFVQPDAIATSLLPGGELLTLWRDISRTQEEIGRFSPQDAEKYPAYLETIGRFSDAISQFAMLPPPDPFNLRPRTLFAWLRTALKIRSTGARRMMELLRSLPLSAQEFLDEWFEDESLKGLLAFPSITSTMQGPQAAGTAFQLFYQHMQASHVGYRTTGIVRAGMGKFSRILKDAAASFGAEIVCDAPVSAILTEGRKAVGVERASGEIHRSNLVISSADPRRTLFGLLPPTGFEPRTMRRVRNIKFKGSTAKINLALSRLPQGIAGHPEQARFHGFLTLSPGVDYLERAHDDAKYGRISASLAMEMVIPTLLDPALAPPEQHILSIDVRFAPYHLHDGSWETQKERLLETAMSQLVSHFPDLGACVLHTQVISPLDYERDFGLSEGSLHHGQMGLDQLLFMRPIPGFVAYRSPIENLYLCGSGTHPGGGITGLPGYHAARQILKET